MYRSWFGQLSWFSDGVNWKSLAQYETSTNEITSSKPTTEPHSSCSKHRRVLETANRRSYEESHIICWHAWYHLQKMYWSHLANSFGLQVVRFGTSSLNSQTIHTWNHHKQIQERADRPHSFPLLWRNLLLSVHHMHGAISKSMQKEGRKKTYQVHQTH